MKLLNIGGNNHSIPIPDRYSGWEHHILDVTEQADYKIDLLKAIKESIMEPAYNACYMSHVFEHFHPHEIVPILMWIKQNVLIQNGTLEIRVPDFKEVIKEYQYKNSLVDPLYNTNTSDPISTLDIIFGHQKQIKQGNLYMMHKSAFDKVTLDSILKMCGYYNIEFLDPLSYLELRCIAYVNP